MATIFERNPKKMLLLVVLIGVLGIVFGSEKYLAWQEMSSERAGIVRYIRMRETPPLAEYRIIPNEHYMKTASKFVREKHRMKTERNGFIYPSAVYEKPDLKLVFLGGSVVECLYVEEENRFPYVVGRLLEKKKGKVNSYNGGVAGNDSMHSINILLNKVIPLNPDIVLMMHNINDLTILLRAKTYWNDIPTRSNIIEETLKMSLSGFVRQLKNIFIPHLYIRLRNLRQRVAEKLHHEDDEFAGSRGHLEYDRELLKKNFSENLQTFIGICKARNITPVLMTMANRLKANPDEVERGGMGNLPLKLGIEYEQYRNLFIMFNKIIRDVGKKNNVLVIDLAEKIPMDPKYIYDVIHLTDSGSIKAAEIIAVELEKHVLESTR